MQRLLLIDGHAILHRAYHALPPNFSAPDGTPTNAAYGFTIMLLRLIEDLKPQYLIVTFDLPAPNFRQQIYTQYQGKRPEMGDGLKPQIRLVHEMLTALGVPFFELAGYEADDVIGTLARQASKTHNSKIKIQNLETIIVTGDRDMLQLVNKNVKVCVPVKGLSETKIYDEENILEEFKVKPSQWVDVKALKGDQSDNYPGVAGIGPKTAQDLIAKYGSLENIYEKLDEFEKTEKRTAEKLAAGAEDAGMAKKLATIVCDAPVHLDLEKSEINKINWTRGSLYMAERLGFRTIVERIRKTYLNKNPTSPRLRGVNNKSSKKDEQMSLL